MEFSELPKGFSGICVASAIGYAGEDRQTSDSPDRQPAKGESWRPGRSPLRGALNSSLCFKNVRVGALNGARHRSQSARRAQPSSATPEGAQPMFFILLVIYTLLPLWNPIQKRQKP